MEKHDIFQFTAPNGVKVIGVVLDKIAYKCYMSWHITTFLCYAQNRLFTYLKKEDTNCNGFVIETIYEYDKVVVDYAILPDYDEVLNNYNPGQDV